FMPEVRCKTNMRPFFMFMERLNERANGELVIDYLGGSEIIPMGEQPTAVRKGVVDITMISAHQYADMVTASNVVQLSRISPQEERESGFFAYLQDLHMKGGLFLVGRAAYTQNSSFYIFINKKVETPYDLAGLKFGPGSIALNFLPAVGAVPTRVSLVDFYGAVEQGVLDGFIMTLVGFSRRSWHEVIDYTIDQPIFANNVVTIMSLDAWNRLPAHLQGLIQEVAISVEQDYTIDDWKKLEAEEKVRMLENGVEFIKFSPADNEWFVNTAYQIEWEAWIEKYPEVATKMKDLLLQ
ncbi:TRAP transporter substrate-binding protein DctP, partial [Chloroflexota bacterium]